MEMRTVAKHALKLACGLACLAGPASADNGVRPIWTDFQPAVATQYRPPDGGRVYPKPNTRALIRTEDRRAAERAEVDLNRRAGQPIVRRDTTEPRAPRRMRDPLAIPPASPTPLPGTPPAIETPSR